MADPKIHERPKPTPIDAATQAKIDEARRRSDEARAAHAKAIEAQAPARARLRERAEIENKKRAEGDR